MPTKDTSEIKEKIVSFLKIKGPSLPVHIAKEIGMSILFTSAFLSELISERRIKISNMKIGSSSLHYLEGQESRLENFSQHLNNKEKEAFDLLKKKKFLKDSEVQPAIRVAFRAIKDFAIPFDTDEGLMWRYFTVSQKEYTPKIPETPKKLAAKKQESEQKQEQKQEPEKPKPEEKEKKPRKRKSSPKPSQKKNEKFFSKVKDFLNQKQIEIIEIEGFTKKDLILKVRKNQRDYLLVAFNKKRVREADIIKAYKKAKDENLRYLILSLGEPLKKTQNLIEAAKSLAGIEKID